MVTGESINRWLWTTALIKELQELEHISQHG